MTGAPPLRLSRLRDIGWSLWDPIGLAPANGAWPPHGADEYDGYLLRTATMLRQGASIEQCARFLVEVETGHMGLSRKSDTADRAERCARAILSELDAEKLGPGSSPG